MERPVYSKEPVMQLALTLGSGGMLVVKPNYVAEKLAPYVCTLTITIKAALLSFMTD